MDKSITAIKLNELDCIVRGRDYQLFDNDVLLKQFLEYRRLICIDILKHSQSDNIEHQLEVYNDCNKKIKELLAIPE